MRALLALACLFLACLLATSAHAHAASDGYLTLTFADGPSVAGRWDIALVDLDAALSLAGGSATTDLTPAAVRAKGDAIEAFAFSHLALTGDGAACPVTPGELGFTDHAGAIYVTLAFTAACRASPAAVALDYTLFFDKDPKHRGLTRIEDGAASRSVIFSSRFRRVEYQRREPSRGDELGAAVRSGVTHIATGTDHLLFLLALLLPAVLRRDGDAWLPVPRLRDAAIEVAKVVTAFTVAHSITLSLAVLGVVRLSPRFVEPAIAASIVMAAAQNLAPRAALSGRRWPLAFALGLLHGFGFSAALVDLGLRREDLVPTLFGFNLGVEVGQLVAVAAFLPVAFALRGWSGYRPIVLRGGSVVVALVACVWFVQRLAPPLSP